MDRSTMPSAEAWEEFDWYPVQESVMTQLRLALARHKKIGAAITLGEGEELISSLATDIVGNIRGLVGDEH